MNLLQRQLYLFGATAAILVVGATVARAESVAIENAGFEEPGLNAGDLVRFEASSGGTVPGWTCFHGYAAYIARPTADLYLVNGGTSEGSQCFGSFTRTYTETGEDTDPVLIGQTLLATYQPNTKYTLSAYVGRYASGQYEGYGIGLADDAGFMAVKSDNVAYDVGYGWAEVAVAGASPDAGQWLKVSVTYTTPATGGPIGKAIRLRLAGANLYTGTDASGAFVAFDNVALDATAVPEPGTITLAGLGLVGLLAYAWRKRK